MARRNSSINQYLSTSSLGSDFDLTSSSASTFSAWLNMAATAGTSDWSAGVFTHSNGALNDGWGVHSKRVGSDVYHIIFIFGGNSGWQSAGVTTGVWYHLAAIFDQATNDLILYINGSVAYSTTNSNDSAITSTSVFVASAESAQATASWDGGIAEAAYWPNRRLTADEIAALSHGFSPRLVQPNGLKLYLPLVADNASAIGPTLTEVGTATFEAHVPVIYPALPLIGLSSSGGAAAQTINANAISSGATVYAPAITPGAVTIALNAVSSGATVYAPTLTPGAITVALDAIASATTVHEPAVTVGAATITPDAISSAAAVYEPAITTGPVTVALNAIDSTAQVYEPAISSGAITITPNVIESTAEVYAPAVTPGAVTIQADSISSAAQVYEPAISTGALLIQPNRIESTAEVYAPAISGGAVVIAPDRIESGAQVFEPTITPGAVTVAPDFVTSSAAVYAPGIGYVIRPNIIDIAAAVYAPAVTTGATTIAAAFIASAAQVYAPTITGGVPAVIGGILITLPADYTSISVPTDYTSITIPADSGRSS